MPPVLPYILENAPFVETYETSVPYDYVVKYFHIEVFCGFCKSLSDIYVLIGGFGVARWVIVYENHTVGFIADCPFEGFLNIYWGGVKVAGGDGLIPQKAVFTFT